VIVDREAAWPPDQEDDEEEPDDMAAVDVYDDEPCWTGIIRC
jgi:hypothetical protein